MDNIVTFFTDPLRLTLVATAIVVILGIFIFGRRGNTIGRDVEELSPLEINKALNSNDDDNVLVKEPVGSADEVDADYNHDDASIEQQDNNEHFVVLNIVAPEGMGFTGLNLLSVFSESGLEYGKFKIFHYPHRHNQDLSMFSVVNMLKPGFFDIDQMHDFTTTGLSMFMRIPVADGSNIEAFSTMLAIAQNMTRKLGGHLLDQDRELLTQDKLEDLKQFVKEQQTVTSPQNATP